jgi:Tfp pilus assembly protein PilO
MQNLPKVIIKTKQFPFSTYFSSERNQKFLGLSLTLFAIAFFGFFAIKPTVSTILELRKEISDGEFVLNQLDTKIKNLTELRKQYANLEGDLPIINNAITIQPDVQVLFAQIQAIGQSSNISIKKLQNFEVEVIKNDNSVNKNYYSYSFTVAGSGTFESIINFAQTLTSMERIISIDTFSVSNATSDNNGSLDFNIQGTAYFKDNL